MARSSRSVGKNYWVLFLIILLGIVAGSVLGYMTKDVKYLDWLDNGLYFSIGDNKSTSVVTLDLGVLIINFGLKIKISIGSIIGAIVSIFIYRKL